MPLMMLFFDFLLASSILFVFLFSSIWVAFFLSMLPKYKSNPLVLLLFVFLVLLGVTFSLHVEVWIVRFFTFSLVVGVICCFYALYLIRQKTKSHIVFLAGMLATAMLLHVFFVFFLTYPSTNVDLYWCNFMNYLSFWMGGGDPQGVLILLSLKAVSFVYMGLFIGLCAQWLNSGFRNGKE